MRRSLVVCLLATTALGAIPAAANPSPTAAAAAATDRRIDEHSYAEPRRVVIKHLALDLAVDFAAKQLRGTATLDLDWVVRDYRRLILDTRDLTIDKVEGLTAQQTWKPLPWKLGARDAAFGSPLTIQPGAYYPQIKITYRTAPTASGLQWLDAAITDDGKHPFLFTQSQAIHARSWVPLQDTPGVRFTYAARITTPKELVAVMSADNDPKVARTGDYRFKMPQPIPSYLLALAVGDLAFKPLSGRAGVYAQRSVVDAAAAEFVDTEKMIEVTEGLYGGYRWGRYDLLILPASFPFGGMENPRLSFITPTVLVGDRSLTGLIAHELAHSWSGNLITNATWRDVWLNEGFTTYVENRIVEAVYGVPQAEMEAVLSQQELRATIKTSKPAQQRLRMGPLAGHDPDDAGSEVAYEKGQWFLMTLEKRFGRAAFDAFLRKWFDSHAFRSVTTEDFVAFLRSELIVRQPQAISDAELTEWLDGTGIPASAVPATSRRLAAVDAARTRWQRNGASLAAYASGGKAKWTTQELVHFLEGLPPTLRAPQIAALDRTFKLTGTRNGELAERWYPLTIRSNHTAARPAIAAFVEKIGRRKLIVPIYQALAATPDGLAYARATFAKSRSNYHPITIGTLEQLLAPPKPPAPTTPATPPAGAR